MNQTSGTEVVVVRAGGQRRVEPRTPANWANWAEPTAPRTRAKVTTAEMVVHLRAQRAALEVKLAEVDRRLAALGVDEGRPGMPPATGPTVRELIAEALEQAGEQGARAIDVASFVKTRRPSASYGTVQAMLRRMVTARQVEAFGVKEERRWFLVDLDEE